MASFAPSTRVAPKGRLEWNVRFAPLPIPLITHPAFSELSGNGLKLVLAMLSGYVGNNNGHLVATHSQMRRFGFNSKESLSRAIRELLAFGLIVRTRAQVLRSPALYAITWLPINAPRPGTPYDAGTTATMEAGDDWRHIDASWARSGHRVPLGAAIPGAAAA